MFVVSEDADTLAEHGRSIAIGAVVHGVAVKICDTGNIGHKVTQSIRENDATCVEYRAIGDTHGEIITLAVDVCNGCDTVQRAGIGGLLANTRA